MVRVRAGHEWRPPVTREQYLTDKAKLDDLNRQIDEAPPARKPVFPGIVKLYNRIKRYERKNKI
jgi:hypothetical protein